MEVTVLLNIKYHGGSSGIVLDCISDRVQVIQVFEVKKYHQFSAILHQASVLIATPENKRLFFSLPCLECL